MRDPPPLQLQRVEHDGPERRLAPVHGPGPSGGIDRHIRHRDAVNHPGDIVEPMIDKPVGEMRRIDTAHLLSEAPRYRIDLGER